MKKTQQLRAALAIAALAIAGMAHAQLVANMVAPAQGKTGEVVKVTVNLDVMSGMNCGLHMHWGDGVSDTYKINQPGDVPLQASHTYAKAGTYKIVVEPKRVGSVLKCGGKNQEATIAVTGAGGPPAVVAAGAPAAAVCPAGWKLASPGVNKKTQAFTCTAPANSKLPDPKVSCPGELTYFENAKKGQLGCRP